MEFVIGAIAIWILWKLFRILIRKNNDYGRNTMGKENATISDIINKYGFEDASIIFYGLVLAKIINKNDHITLLKIKQFVREEFDAASQGDLSSQNFVEELCPDSSWYKGAMFESPEYPIDEAGGPQQTLLGIIIPLMHENTKLGVKLRCHIVEMLYDDYKIFNSAMLNLQVSSSAVRNFKNRRERLEYLLKNNVI